MGPGRQVIVLLSLTCNFVLFLDAVHLDPGSNAPGVPPAKENREKSHEVKGFSQLGYHILHSKYFMSLSRYGMGRSRGVVLSVVK